MADRSVEIATDEDLQFLFRARTHGYVTWACPTAGLIQRTELDARTIGVKCSSRKLCCGRRWGLGYVLHSLTELKGGDAMPEDMIIPGAPRENEIPLTAALVLSEALVAGELGKWRQGQFIHRIRT